MPRTIVVFDFNWGGHIPAYHHLIVEAALAAGARVVSLSGAHSEVRDRAEKEGAAVSRLIAPHCPELGRSPERKRLLGFLRYVPYGFSVWSRIRSSPRLRAIHAGTRWSACRATLNRVHPLLDGDALLFLPFLDDMLELRVPNRTMDVGLSWAGIYMGASDLRDDGRRPDVELRLRRLASLSCCGIAVLDELVQAKVQESVPGTTTEWLPDVADCSLQCLPSQLCCDLERRAKGRKVIGLLGHLTEEKSVGLFLDVATASTNRDLYFLIAGQFESLSLRPEIRRKLIAAAAGRWENIMAIPGRIPSEADFNGLLNRVDVVFAVYRNFCRSSNILTKAALYRRPIVVASGYCMADRVSQYRLGYAINQDSRVQCESALRQLLAFGARGADYSGFQQDFSLVKFRTKIAEFMDRCGKVAADRATPGSTGRPNSCRAN